MRYALEVRTGLYWSVWCKFNTLEEANASLERDRSRAPDKTAYRVTEITPEGHRKPTQAAKSGTGAERDA